MDKFRLFCAVWSRFIVRHQFVILDIELAIRKDSKRVLANFLWLARAESSFYF